MAAPAGSGTALTLVLYGLATGLRDHSERTYITGNATLGTILLVAARRRGADWSDLGLARRDAARGLLTGVAVAGVTAVGSAAVAAAGAHTAVGRRALGDRRATLPPRQLAWQALGRIPLGTAAFEEIAFRGVLFGLIARARGRWAALAVSSATFGLWHVGPTLAALEINEAPYGRLRTCLSAVALTTAAGVGLGGLRANARHVAASWLVHWAANATTLLAAARWQARATVPAR